tara:strand:- start:50 stop:1075 length:1026 start_codon:yes stop_codon:yes gene_type:complete
MSIKALLTESNIRDYYSKNKQFKFMAPYKMDQLFEYRKFSDKYVDVKSNKQIKTIIKHSKDKNSYIYLKLITLLGKHIQMNDAATLITNLLSLPLKDSTIYKFLKSIKNDNIYDGGPHMINYAPHGLLSSGRDKKVKQMKFVLEREFVEVNFKPKTYLDFGCGDCKLVKYLGEALNIKKENIYGADIESWGNYSNDKRSKLDINFVDLKLNQKFNFKDNMFSVISAMMVLHHIENLDFCLKEMNRIMEMGGYFFITEHMVVNYLEKMLVDIEHSIYEIAYRNNNDYHKTFVNNYYYITEWSVILNKYGFEYVNYDYLLYNITDQDDATKRAWFIYKKVKNL